MSFNMGQDERKATELDYTCITHPLPYSPSFQGVKWQMPKGGYLYLLWILIFHSTPFKLKFCSNLMRKNSQGLTNHKGNICYLRKAAMKEGNSEVAFTVFPIEKDRMIPF